MLGITGEGTSQVIVTNPTGLKCQLGEGTVLEETSPVELVVAGTDPRCELSAKVRQVQSEAAIEWRKRRLAELVGDLELLNNGGKQRLTEFLSNHHSVFCLEEHKRGKTDLVEMHILTGDAAPKRLPVRRMLFAKRSLANSRACRKMG